MIKAQRYICTFFLGLLIAPVGHAAAHPHVWVTMRSELIYAADGSVIGVRHTWAFDDAFSVFAIQGLESKRRGKFTREELAPLAETNVTSLREYDFFTFAKADGTKAQFNRPIDYYLDYDPKETVLTLHFTLPFKSPVRAKHLSVSVYDPTFFVDFGFTSDNPVALVGAPAACRLSVAGPENASLKSQRLPEAFFNTLDSSKGWGVRFANRIAVTCP